MLVHQRVSACPVLSERDRHREFLLPPDVRNAAYPEYVLILRWGHWELVSSVDVCMHTKKDK